MALSLFLLGAVAFAFAPPSAAQTVPLSSASDPRATFHSGNVISCADVGLPGDIQVGSISNLSATGTSATGAPDVVGTVGTNTGSIQPGHGQEVNITVNSADVVVDAVIVKGSDGYNQYSPDPANLPPTLPPPQHYISPLTGGGVVPNISHRFVCYRLVTPPPPGSLTLFKTLLAPAWVPLATPPTTYTAIVNCNDGNSAHQNVTVTFDSGGGEGTPILTGIPTGTLCTVAENTSGLPPGTVVSYEPPEAATTGVTITSNTAVEVNITNDFSHTQTDPGSLALEKTVVNPDGVTLPTNFTAGVDCDDGTSATVTFPNTGGPGTPSPLTPALGATCNIEEVPVPTGWTVTYSVDGGAASSTPPTVTITSSTTITVNITNTAPPTTTTSTTVAPTTTTSTTVAPTTTTTSSISPTSSTAAPASTTSITALTGGSGSASDTTAAGNSNLPTTGANAFPAIIVGLVAVACGMLLLLVSLLPLPSGPRPRHRRRRSS